LQQVLTTPPFLTLPFYRCLSPLQQQTASVLALLDAEATAASFAKGGSRAGGAHAARAAAAQRSRALSSFGHIFEAQSALGQISVGFDSGLTDSGGKVPRGSGAASSTFFESRGPGDFSRRSGNDARSYAEAYCYILKPTALTVRVVMPVVGNPLDKPKVDATISVDPIELLLADRQYALLMRVLGEHNDAWEARSLGLKYRSILSVGPDDDSDEVAAEAASAGDSAHDSDSPPPVNSDADSDDDTPDFRAIGRRTGQAATKRPAPQYSRAKPAQAASPARPQVPRFVSKHQRSWRRVFHALVMRRRATLREVERHRYITSIAIEYIQLYLRRLKATELQGLAPLSQAERKSVTCGAAGALSL
jgi:hypothetical protein